MSDRSRSSYAAQRDWKPQVIDAIRSDASAQDGEPTNALALPRRLRGLDPT
jgi:hypothetical protein